MTYPDSCLRGIRVLGWIYPNGKVSGEAFVPDKNSGTERKDDLIETSIAWEDDEGVLDFCFTKCKNNYNFGAVRLSTKEIDHIIQNNTIGIFSYERKIVDDNIYHGNLLFDNNIEHRKGRLIEGALAFFSSHVIANPNTK